MTLICCGNQFGARFCQILPLPLPIKKLQVTKDEAPDLWPVHTSGWAAWHIGAGLFGSLRNCEGWGSIPAEASQALGTAP